MTRLTFSVKRLETRREMAVKCKRSGALLAFVGLLSACGGGGGSSSPPIANPNPNPPPPSAAGCSLGERQAWAAAELREWYLFPETLPATNPIGIGNLLDFVDAMTATARAQGRDRYFTYVTSIAEENAFYQQGASAGFGIRLSIDAAGRLFIAEAFEGAPALAAGIDRGTEILAIGTSAADLRTVSAIVAAEGAGGINAALGPSTAGTTRVLQVTDAGGTRNVSVTKADFAIAPVSSRYGARIIDDGGRRVGYVNLRTFIDTADPALRNAFAQFRAQGITEVIVDLRYNGGGLVSIGELLGDLLGANHVGQVFSRTTFRPEKAVNNETDLFGAQAQAVGATRIAFIGTGGTASASELVINSFLPYLGANAALVGTNTYGKPVGQIARDRAQCDDRLRVIAFATQNSAGQGAYFNGLAPFMQSTCRAEDDLTRQLGDPQEASIRASLDFLAGRPCTAIAGAPAAGGRQAAPAEAGRELVSPRRPSPAQREVPGFF